MSESENCHVEPIEKPLDREALSDATAALMVVRGLGCPRCAMRVRNGLLTVDGVFLAEVHLENGFATAAYDPQIVTPDVLTQAVTSAGNDGKHHYHAEVIKTLPAKEVLQL